VSIQDDMNDALKYLMCGPEKPKLLTAPTHTGGTLNFERLEQMRKEMMATMAIPRDLMGKSPIQEIRESMSRLYQQLNPPREVRSGKSLMATLLHNARQAELHARDDRSELCEAARKAKADALHLPRAGTIFGIPVHVIPDDIARVTRPARVHRDRGKVIGHRLFANGYVRKPSPYHLRIQKKWNKRYGFITENRVYFMERPKMDFTRVLGGHDPYSLAHERVMVMGEGHYRVLIDEAKRMGVL
jgi:hypothetical protein